MLLYRETKFLKFLSKWVELENSIVSEVTQSQKNTHTWYAITNKWILAQIFGIPKTQFTDQMKLKKKEEQIMNSLFLIRKGEQKTHRRRYRDKV